MPEVSRSHCERRSRQSSVDPGSLNLRDASLPQPWPRKRSCAPAAWLSAERPVPLRRSLRRDRRRLASGRLSAGCASTCAGLAISSGGLLRGRGRFGRRRRIAGCRRSLGRLAPEPQPLGSFAPVLRIVGRDHWVIIFKIVSGTVFVWRQPVCRKVTLQRPIGPAVDMLMMTC